MAGASMVGADVEQLRRLAQRLRRTADGLLGSERDLRSLVQSTTWQGADAGRFRKEWVASAAAMTAAARRLTEAAVDVERNASEQELVSSAGPGTGSPGVVPAGPAAAASSLEEERTLTRILHEYQVVKDDLVMWAPSGAVGFVGGLFRDVEPVEITKTEADLLDTFGLLQLKRFEEIRDDAFDTSMGYYPGGTPYEQNDGHQDAHRHAYWNALMTKSFGADFAERFGTAHEGHPANNAAAREAMDLYNNELGRRIAVDNEGASDQELAKLVHDAVERGEAVVVGADGTSLRFSDDVRLHEHGVAKDLPGGGRIEPEGAHTHENNPATS